MENKTYTYQVEDIFDEIPDDPKNVLMNLPPEICEEMNLKEGDNIKIELGDKGTLIITKLDKD